MISKWMVSFNFFFLILLRKLKSHLLPQLLFKHKSFLNMNHSKDITKIHNNLTTFLN